MHIPGSRTGKNVAFGSLCLGASIVRIFDLYLAMESMLVEESRFPLQPEAFRIARMVFGRMLGPMSEPNWIPIPIFALLPNVTRKDSKNCVQSASLPPSPNSEALSCMSYVHV